MAALTRLRELERERDAAMAEWTGYWRSWGMPKVAEAIRLVEDDGWVLVRTAGSHRHFQHPTKPGTVTIAGRPSKDLAPGTWGSILRQAGLR